MIRCFHCDIAIMAPTNTRRLWRADGSRTAHRATAHADLLGLYLKRAAEESPRWVRCSTPTAAFAHEAKIDLAQFEEFLFASTWADLDDPIATWQDFAEVQSSLVAHLSGKPSGIAQGPPVDIAFSVEDRIFVSCDGRLNMPDGEVFTEPVKESAHGWVESTSPAIYRGVDAGNVRLELKAGKVIGAEAEKNQSYLTAMLDSDEGARRLGEFGVGTNGRIRTFTRNMLFDEKIAGTVHFALGAGYPESGSVNESGIHWDFLCDMRDGGTIAMDGQVVYEAGTFTL